MQQQSLNGDKLHPLTILKIISFSFKWFETLSLAVIIVNCLSIAMFNPCEDNLKFQSCKTSKCRTLRLVDLGVSAFFLFEMVTKMTAMCAVGHKKAYLVSPWNKLDFAIVLIRFDSPD